MSIYAVYLTLENSVASKSFKFLKQFDPSLELGPFLEKLHAGERVVELEHLSDSVLEQFIALLDQFDAAEVNYSVSIATQPSHRNRDGSKTRLSSVAELKFELLQTAEYDRRVTAFQRFCTEQGFKDGHWILVDREELFKSTLRRCSNRSRSEDWNNLLNEEINYLYVDAFESDLFHGGFGAYFAGEDGDSAMELAATLSDLGSTEVLKLLHQAMSLMGACGGYSNQSTVRVPNLARCSIDLFNDVDTQFYHRSEDIGGMALTALEEAYEEME